MPAASSRPFFVVGTAKAGTTSLHADLSRASELALTDPKETWYFCGDAYRAAEARQVFLRQYLPSPVTASWYGEIATSYLYFPPAPERLAAAFPDAHIIAVLRDPVARAFSDWWMMHSSGAEPLGFEEAITVNLTRLAEGRSFDERRWYAHLQSIASRRGVTFRTYVDYGHYADQLDRYVARFPRDRLHVLVLEDVAERPGGLVGAVAACLGVSVPSASSEDRRNVSFASRPVRRLVGLAHRLGLGRVLPSALRTRLVRRVARVGRRPEPAPTTMRRLADHFAPGLDRLERDWGLPVGVWRDPEPPRRES